MAIAESESGSKNVIIFLRSSDFCGFPMQANDKIMHECTVRLPLTKKVFVEHDLQK